MTLAVACTSVTKDDGAESGPCSDGARWPRATSFAYEQNVPSGLPACTPHCGPNTPSVRYPTMLTSPLERFVCRCTSGNWACTIDAANAGASMWECSSSADAGP